jgi:thioredoxin 1
MDFSNGKHVVKFSATWCGPCKAYAPIFEEATEGVSGVAFHKLDADDHSDILAKYGVRGVPTTLFIKDGEVIETKVGIQTKETLKEIIEKL